MTNKTTVWLAVLTSAIALVLVFQNTTLDGPDAKPPADRYVLPEIYGEVKDGLVFIRPGRAARVVALLDNPGVEPPNPRSTVIQSVPNQTETLAATTAFPEGAWSISPSPDWSSVLVAFKQDGADRVGLVSSEGKLLWSVPAQGRIAHFSQDGTCIGLIKDKIMVGPSQQIEVLSAKGVPRPPIQPPAEFDQAILLTCGDAVIASGQSIYRYKAGQVLWSLPDVQEHVEFLVPLDAKHVAAIQSEGKSQIFRLSGSTVFTYGPASMASAYPDIDPDGFADVTPHSAGADKVRFYDNANRTRLTLDLDLITGSISVDEEGIDVPGDARVLPNLSGDQALYIQGNVVGRGKVALPGGGS
jgi:hypothetical protein